MTKSMKKQTTKNQLRVQTQVRAGDCMKDCNAEYWKDWGYCQTDAVPEKDYIDCLNTACKNNEKCYGDKCGVEPLLAYCKFS